jgi:arabinogalactan endo-1,4-beta-galactosidase
VINTNSVDHDDTKLENQYDALRITKESDIERVSVKIEAQPWKENKTNGNGAVKDVRRCTKSGIGRYCGSHG